LRNRFIGYETSITRPIALAIRCQSLIPSQLLRPNRRQPIELWRDGVVEVPHRRRSTVELERWMSRIERAFFNGEATSSDIDWIESADGVSMRRTRRLKVFEE